MNKFLVKVVLVFFVTSLSACSTLSQDPPSYAPSPSASETQPPPGTEQLQERQSVNAESQNKDQNKLQPIDVSSVNTKNPLIDVSIEKSMDTNDKVKMSKALDKAPGKTTEWTNEQTAITYTVTPIKKVVLNNNPFCREYETQISRRGNMNTVRGTACIAEDGNWHTI